MQVSNYKVVIINNKEVKIYDTLEDVTIDFFMNFLDHLDLDITDSIGIDTSNHEKPPFIYLLDGVDTKKFLNKLFQAIACLEL